MKTIDQVRPICDISIMRDHHDRIACFLMEDIDEIHDPIRIALIQIAGWLICEEILHISNKSSCNSHSLLLASRELRWIPHSFTCESYLLEDHTRLIATRSMGDIEYKIDILTHRQIGDEFERLEYERDMLPSVFDHLISAQLYDIGMSDLYSTTIRRDDPSDE